MKGWLNASTLAAGVVAVATTLTLVPKAEASESHVHHIRRHHVRQDAIRLDHSGKVQHGLASYYAPHFNGRKMANGRRFDPNAAVAASKTLPLGTTVKVTNLQNGRSAIVLIEDRGPYVAGRVVDLAPQVARRLGMKIRGVVPVAVTPLTVPQPDGTIKAVAGAGEEVAALP